MSDTANIIANQTARWLLEKRKQDRSFKALPQSFHALARVSVDRMRKFYKGLQPLFVVLHDVECNGD